MQPKEGYSTAKGNPKTQAPATALCAPIGRTPNTRRRVSLSVMCVMLVSACGAPADLHPASEHRIPLSTSETTIFEDNFSPQQPGWSFASPSAGFLGELNNNENVSSVTLEVSATGGGGTLEFDLLTIRSLDDGTTCCTDTFTLIFNGQTAFSGAFGDRGTDSFLSNPAGATMTPASPIAGGNTRRIFVPVTLLAGANSITWSYSPLQSFDDEAWGLDNVRLVGDGRANLAGSEFHYNVVRANGPLLRDGPLPTNLRFTTDLRINNDGQADASNFDVDFYLSQDGTLDSGDILVGSNHVAEMIAAGGSYNVFPQWVLVLPELPQTFFGDVQLLAVIDSSDNVQESDENDNMIAKTMPLYDPVAPRAFLPAEFDTRRQAERFLATNGFREIPPRLNGRADSGWSRPLSTPTFSRRRGTLMSDPAAFRIHADVRRRDGAWRVWVQGADATFNPLGFQPAFGEPSPRWAGLATDPAWLIYVLDYHDRF